MHLCGTLCQALFFSLFFGGQNVNLEGVCPLSLSEVPLYL